MRLVNAIVTKSHCPYVPTNVEVEMVLDDNDLPYSIHRKDNGAGTYLSNKFQQKSVVFQII